MAEMEAVPPELAAVAENAAENTAGAGAGRPSAGRSVGKMLAATVVTGATGVALTFWIPALLPVDEFGYWRSFLLYAGYAGFLHLGMVDGALLDWTRPHALRRGGSLGQALSVLTIQHLAITVLGVVLGLALLNAHFAYLSHFREIFIALLAYALVFNLTGLVQAHLQSRLRFFAVALAMAMPGVVFVLSLAVLRLRRVTLHALLLAYLLSWTVTLAILLSLSFGDRAKDRRKEEWGGNPPLAAGGRGMKGSGGLSASLSHIGAGWAIMMANTSYGLMQSADRITVNLTRPIHDFAIYSLAQSSIYVPVAIIAAVARVAFSHFAMEAEGGREEAYRDTTRLLTLAWMLLLPYYYAVEWAVARWLPRYTPGLPAGRVLLLSVLFLSLISVVQANAAALAGAQRRFFAGSAIAVVLAFATAWVCSNGLGWHWTGSLTAVAWSQVLSAGVWWLGNEWAANKRLGSRDAGLAATEIATVAFAFAAAATGLYLVSMLAAPALLKALLYYVLEAIPIYLLYGRQLGGTMPLLRAVFRSGLSRPMRPRPMRHR